MAINWKKLKAEINIKPAKNGIAYLYPESNNYQLIILGLKTERYRHYGLSFQKNKH